MPNVRLTVRPGPYRQLMRAPTGEVGRYVEGRLRAVEVAAKQRCPVDEGQVRASSKIEMRDGANGAEGSLTFTAPHSLFVHEDTKPHWPPIQALEKWARRHGFPNAFLVARAIALHGTKGTPFLWEGLVSVIARARRRRPGSA